MTLPSNNRNESHGKSLSGSPPCASFDAASGGGVPTLDVRPSCRAAAAAQTTSTDRMQTCMADEQGAHDQLVKAWTKFNIADRAACFRTMMDFEPTYTELLTCLEMASDARKLPEELY
jgi:hypothetical protein